MRLRVLRLLLAAALLPWGCDGGSGPGVGSPSTEKGVTDGSGSASAPKAKAVSPRLKAKREKQGVAPASAE